jgi:hypothetical protein
LELRECQLILGEDKWEDAKISLKMPMTKHFTKTPKRQPMGQHQNCPKMEFLSRNNAEFFPFLHDYFQLLKTIENRLQSI